MSFAEYPIRVGSMLFTAVDPERGHEVSYNRWYERDHYYAGCMIGPGLLAGSRWVATADLKALRFPEDSDVVPAIGAGSYVAIYWINDGQFDEWNAWAVDQVNWLYGNDRGFQHRVHAHTAMYLHDNRWYRDEDPVPLELALDRNYQGLVSLAVQREEGVSQEDLEKWFSTHLPDFLRESPIASVAAWTAVPLKDDAPAFVPRDPNAATRSMQLYFLEGDPRESWDTFREWAARIDASGIGRVTYCAPWIPTVVGTDTYTDRLWD
ncbi:hypothetical protein B4N89_06365 [Embleya scabrispora]|uniref:Uncharacterized protein n=1 Tax=Embleya scabrispora TaxID=159449 RepID=A0A1T3NUS6_9ACTN|nr:hypothetical protein [Embleya scabrispora]OPC80633.1 hypothetical protein B4N89_06365 [Embleya scabrispora]